MIKRAELVHRLSLHFRNVHFAIANVTQILFNFLLSISRPWEDSILAQLSLSLAAEGRFPTEVAVLEAIVVKSVSSSSRRSVSSSNSSSIVSCGSSSRSVSSSRSSRSVRSNISSRSLCCVFVVGGQFHLPHTSI